MGLLAGACTVSPPDDLGPGPQFPYGEDAGVDAEDGGVEQPVELLLDAVPLSTTWSSLPLTGIGPAGGRILVQATSGPVSGTVLPSGAFCVDVPLIPEAINEIAVRAVDQDGRYSRPEHAQTEQRGLVEPPPPEEAPAPVNLARGGTVLNTTLTSDEGELSAMIDGNTNTYARLVNAWMDDDWLVLRLAESGPVDRLVVRTTVGCTLRTFDLYLSEDESAEPPSEGAGGWHRVWRAEEEEAEADREIEIEPTSATLLGMQLIGEGCTSFGTGAHEIREIEAWTTPMGTTTTPPPPDTQTCESASF